MKQLIIIQTQRYQSFPTKVVRLVAVKLTALAKTRPLEVGDFAIILYIRKVKAIDNWRPIWQCEHVAEVLCRPIAQPTHVCHSLFMAMFICKLLRIFQSEAKLCGCFHFLCRRRGRGMIHFLCRKRGRGMNHFLCRRRGQGCRIVRGAPLVHSHGDKEQVKQ